VVGAWDATRAERVAVFGPKDDPAVWSVWQPWDAASFGYAPDLYVDSACSQPVAGVRACAADVSPEVVLDPLAIRPDCSLQQFRQAGVRVDSRELFAATSASDCAAASASNLPPHVVFEIAGPEIDDGAFAAVKSFTEGTGPVRLELPGSDASPVALSGAARYVDSRTGQACQPARAADGSLRCFPAGAFDERYYTDPACAKLLAVVPPPDSTCPFVPPPRLTLVPDCGFSQTARWATLAKLRALVDGRDLVRGRGTGSATTA